MKTAKTKRNKTAVTLAEIDMVQTALPANVKIVTSVFTGPKNEHLHVRVVKQRRNIAHWYPSNGRLVIGEKLRTTNVADGEYWSVVDVLDKLDLVHVNAI